MEQDLEVKTYSPAMSLGHARKRAAKMLLMATLISLVPCVLIFMVVLEGDFLTSMFEPIHRFMFGQPVWAVVAATSPLAAALLVGYGYMQKAIRRRGSEREAAIAGQPDPSQVQ